MNLFSSIFEITLALLVPKLISQSSRKKNVLSWVALSFTSAFGGFFILHELQSVSSSYRNPSRLVHLKKLY